MPYVPEEIRKPLRPVAIELVQLLRLLSQDTRMGALNYVLSRIAAGVLGVGTMGMNEFPDSSACRYEKINAVIGVLECCKLELFRRLAVPYENRKVAENGDLI